MKPLPAFFLGAWHAAQLGLTFGAYYGGSVGARRCLVFVAYALLALAFASVLVAMRGTPNNAAEPAMPRWRRLLSIAVDAVVINVMAWHGDYVLAAVWFVASLVLHTISADNRREVAP